VAMSAYTGSATVWFDVAFVCFWVFMAKRALNADTKDEEADTLTPEQEARIRVALKNLSDVMNEIDEEVRAEALDAKLKAREKKDEVREVQGPSSNGEPDDS
jgi:uncharacterized membrane protein YukC